MLSSNSRCLTQYQMLNQYLQQTPPEQTKQNELNLLISQRTALEVEINVLIGQYQIVNSNISI